MHNAPDTVDASGSQVHKCTVGEVAVTNLRGIGQPQDVLAHTDAADPVVVLSPDESQAVEPNTQKLSVDHVEELDTAVPHSRSMSADPSAPYHTCSAPLSSSHRTSLWKDTPGDPLYEWYTSPEMDWDECCYLVPHAASPMKLCHPDDPEDPQISYHLESVSWPSEISFSHALSSGLDQHRVLAQILEAEECQTGRDYGGDVGELQKKGVTSLCHLEECNRHLQAALENAQVNLGVSKVSCMPTVASLQASAAEQDILCPNVCALGPGETGEQISNGTEEFLQTKTVPNEVVRGELAKWTPSIQAEYDSLTKESEAVYPISDEELEALIRNPDIQCELVPGRAIFTVKAHTGRLKTRAVACGNHQTSAARSREDKFASGISAEATRMLLRWAGMQDLRVGVLDIKTAFLNAPVVTPNQEVVIVRVPSIMRASGVCFEKYWRVNKALYGLDVAPRSWTLHRNSVIANITSLVDTGSQVRCLPMEEDANVWVVVDCNTDKVISYLALYVDDIMIVGEKDRVEEVAKTLEGKWTTTPVVWAENGVSISFDGFEVELCDQGYESY